jgi:hypothetical protein
MSAWRAADTCAASGSRLLNDLNRRNDEPAFQQQRAFDAIPAAITLREICGSQLCSVVLRRANVQRAPLGKLLNLQISLS